MTLKYHQTRQLVRSFEGLNMTTRIAINSKTTGKWRREMLGNREHIITNMVSIVGDSTMNGIFYPLEQVKESYLQLNNLPAPNSHPTVAGQHISAFHPFAINAFNIGAFVRAPRMKGKKVENELLVDVEVANKSDDGQELIRRIENGEHIGVSTGLTINELEPQTGVDDFGVPFQSIGRGFNFDHVAVLLNEDAAGKHAGTAVVNGQNVIIANCHIPQVTGELDVNAMTVGDLSKQLDDAIKSVYHTGAEREWIWIQEIFIDENKAVFSHEKVDERDQLMMVPFEIDSDGNVSLTGVAYPVRKKVTFEPSGEQPPVEPNDKNPTSQPEGDEMDMKKLVLSIIGNKNNKYTSDDFDSLMEMDEIAIVNAICQETSADDAKEILVNSGVDLEGLAEFKANAEAFKEFKANRDAELQTLRDEIVANSDYTHEMLEGKDKTELEILVNFRKTAKPVGQGGHHPAPAGDAEPQISFE